MSFGTERQLCLYCGAPLAQTWLYPGQAASQEVVFMFFNARWSKVELVCANVALSEGLAGNEWYNCRLFAVMRGWGRPILSQMGSGPKLATAWPTAGKDWMRLARPDILRV